jgi:hypothetical protein
MDQDFLSRSGFGVKDRAEGTRACSPHEGAGLGVEKLGQNPFHLFRVNRLALSGNNTVVTGLEKLIAAKLAHDQIDQSELKLLSLF